jgi:hypothetical protein
MQRVEGSDTLVVMTKTQASSMNTRFLKMKNEINAQKSNNSYLMHVTDSLTTLNAKNKAALYTAEESGRIAEKNRKEQYLAGGAFISWIFLIVLILNG